jgi:transcriptional regulator with XRE-family HTH domain
VDFLREDISTAEVDIFAGQQLKYLRKQSGVSQKSLAERVGITFQQIQKYEKGLNRISVSMLYKFCQLFNVKPSYFFYDTIGSQNKKSQLYTYKIAESKEEADDLIEIINLCRTIKDPVKLKLVKDLIKSVLKQ